MKYVYGRVRHGEGARAVFGINVLLFLLGMVLGFIAALNVAYVYIEMSTPPLDVQYGAR